MSLGSLCSLSNFASARDVQTLGKNILRKMMKTEKPTKVALSLTEDWVTQGIDELVLERSQRAEAAGSMTSTEPKTVQLMREPKGPINKLATATAHHTEQAPESEQHAGADDESDGPDESGGCGLVIRDASVSDAVWNQLQKDRLKEEEEKRELARLEEEEARLRAWLKTCADAKRQHELEEIERRRRVLEEKRKHEAMMQKKLMQLGRCPVGYAWIKQTGGYRCAGGSHYMSDGEVQKLC